MVAGGTVPTGDVDSRHQGYAYAVQRRQHLTVTDIACQMHGRSWP
ncbi:hypothetical protein BV133_506 [Blastochloris viridis]|uniref:Uncharacterized protein n=1 Tax=Blastochloris viridis TaxID=1079 RepID=A0A182CY47_BLAVI|nr:hypothetical protein BV133_506 [Blastochloris viridis]